MVTRIPSLLGRAFFCTATIALSLVARPLEAGPLTFDNIIGSPQCNSPVPSTYGGLSWSSGFLLECNADYKGAQGNTYGSPSGDYAATNSSDIGGGLLEVNGGGSTFDFLGAWFSSFGYQDSFAAYSAQSLELIGYRPGDDPDHPTFVTSFDLDPTQYLVTDLNWTGLGSLFFAAGNGPAADSFTAFGVDGPSWLMDDARFETAAGTVPVPEPSTMLLVSVGLAAVLRRRRSR
jgi:PEP-CTERM motif